MLLLVCFSYTIQAQITFLNPDIENTGCTRCANCAAPDWTICDPSPDVQPGIFGVQLAPKSGCTYAGFAYLEYIGQKLSCALVPGKTYKLTAWLAYDPIYCSQDVNGCLDPGSRGAPGNLLVFAGTTSCSTNELLWQSGVLPPAANKTWTEYQVIFTPTGGPYDYVMFQNNVSASNILIDNISEEISTVVPTVNLIKDEPSCYNGDDASVSISVLGTYTYNFIWSNGFTENGVTSSTNNNLSPGNHTITIRDPLDICAGDVIIPFTINNPAPIKLSTTQVDETCPDACDGSATVRINSGGYEPFTYLWDDPSAQTDSTALNLCAGLYNVVVTDSAGCDTTIAVTINTLGPGADPGLDNTIIVCDTETDINLFLGLLGTPDYGGTWTDESGSGGLTDSTLDATGLSGDYDFKHTVGSNPCVYDATLTVTVNIQPEAGTGYSDVICQTEDTYNLDNNMTGADTGGDWIDDPIMPGAVSGNNFDATQVDPGIYNLTYVVSGIAPCADDSAFVTIEVKRDPIAGSDTTIFVCNTVGPINLFDNLGGTPDTGGVWNDDDLTGLLVGNMFNVTGIAAGDYDFTHTVLDNLPCLGKSATIRVTVEEQRDAGLDHSFVICKNAASVNLLDSLKGTPDVGGIWTYREGGNQVVSNLFNPNIRLSGNYDYTHDGGLKCQTVVATLNITVNEKPSVINTVDTLCDATNLNFQVRIEISGGDPGSYMVDGNLVGSSTFISNWIPTGNSYSFNVDDVNGCGPTTITGAFACDCATRAGSMNQSKLDVCQDKLAVAIHNQTNMVLDPNDSLIYILHTSPNSNIGTVLDTNLLAPEFTFNDNGNMVLETTYYISALAGNNLPDGTVDIVNDLCYSLAPGTPVVFHELPDATISKDTLICDGGTADLELNFPAGNAPYSVIVNDGTSNVTYTGLNNGSIEQVSPTTNTTYTLVSVSDVYGCFQNIAGQQVVVNVNPNPTATFTGSNTTFCEGNGPAQFTVNVTGGAPNFDIVYFDDQAGSNQTITNVSLGNTTFNNAQALTPGTYNYQLVSITDRSNAACKTTYTDQVTVTVYENPEVTFTGDATICENSSTPLNFSFPKGKANFAIDYSLNGSNVAPSLSGITNPDNISVTPGVGTNVYNIDQVTDANGCITTYPANAKQVTVTVNPNPTVNFSPSNITYCLGTDVTAFSFTFNGNGTPDFEIDYNINNGTTQTISNLDFTNNTWTFTPTTFGVYNIEFTEVRDDNCFTTLNDVFTITVYENPTADISPVNTFICQGQSSYVYFDFTGDSPWTAQYNIDNGATQTITSASNRDSLLITPAGSTTITLLDVVSDNTGCVQTGINKSVTVTVTETALVEIVGNNTICYGQSSDLQIVVNQGQGPFALTFNDTNLNGTYSNGDLITVAPDSTRTYSLTGVTDVAGCVWNPTGNDVTITVNPLPTLVFGPDTSICLGQSVDLTFEDFYGVGTPFEVIINNSSAFVNDGDVIQVSPTETTMYTITKVTDGSPQACVNNAPMEVTVEVTPLPSATIRGDHSICYGDTVDLIFDITGYAPFNLTYNSATAGTNNIQNRGNTTTDPVSPVVGTHTYNITNVEMVNFPFCVAPQDSLHGTATVQVNPIPVPRFEMIDIDSCIPVIPTFTNTTDQIFLGTSEWFFGVGEQFEENATTFNRTLIAPRSYDVTLTVTSPFGCVKSWKHPDKIWVRPFPSADFKFNPDPVSVASRQVNLRNESTGGSAFEWTVYNDRLGNEVAAEYSIEDPVHPTPTEEGEYLIHLLTTSIHGCTDETEKIMTVIGEMLINVPNSFTPNGDGINDTFEPIIFGALAEDFVFIIFNKWGEVLYESKDVTNKTWDGRYRGDFVKDDQYVFKVVAKSKYTERIEEVEGSIRLLK
jgi:gliding motility-associated-like protein